MKIQENKSEMHTMEEKYKNNEFKEGVPFEDALDMTGIGKFNYRLFVISSIIILAFSSETFGSSYILISSSCDLNLKTETKGLVGALPVLGVGLSSHFMGWLADTRGRRTMLLISMWMSLVFSVISGFSVNWVMLAVCKFFSAFFGLPATVVIFALLGESTPRALRNKLVMLGGCAVLFTQAFVSLNAYAVLSFPFDVEILPGVHYKSWRLLQLVFSIWCLISVLLTLFLVKESPAFLASQQKFDDSINILSYIHKINYGGKAGEYPVKSIIFNEETQLFKKKNFLISVWEQTVPLFKPRLLKNTLILLYVAIVAYTTTPALMIWTPSIATSYSRDISSDRSKMSLCKLLTSTNNTIAEGSCNDKVEFLAYWWTFGATTLYTIINLVNSYIMKIINKRTMVIFYFGIAGLSSIILPLVENGTIGLILFFLVQLTVECIAFTTGFTVQIYPTYLRGMAIGLTVMTGRFLLFFTLYYVGILVERYCEYGFYGCGAFILSGALVACFLPLDSKDNR